MVLRSPQSTRLIQHVGAGQQRIQQLLKDSDTFMTTLLLLCHDRFPEMIGYEDEDKEWHEPWTQDTVWLAVRDEFNVELPVASLDKIMAGIVISTTDFFFQNTKTFIRLCNIIGGDDTLDPGVFDPAECDEMAWAITEVMFLEPPQTDSPFSDEIRHYIGARLDEEGFVTAPDVLGIGIRSSNHDPLSSFSDDPVMYGAMYENQQRLTEEIQGMLRDNMLLLMTQLKDLPLKNGTTKGLIEKVSKSISR